MQITLRLRLRSVRDWVTRFYLFVKRSCIGIFSFLPHPEEFWNSFKLSTFKDENYGYTLNLTVYKVTTGL
jgi:hypothetical protein